MQKNNEQSTSLTVSIEQLKQMDDLGLVTFFRKLPENCIGENQVDPYWLTPLALDSELEAYLTSSANKSIQLVISPQ